LVCQVAVGRGTANAVADHSIAIAAPPTAVIKPRTATRPNS
jgi:hypothetical protein